MDDGLGLIISDDHETTINSFDAVPLSFRAKDVESLPDWESPLEAWHQQQTSSCFPAGTLIRMASGAVVPIDKIQLLNEVTTAEGNTGTVVRMMVKRHESEICVLTMWGHKHLRATPEHPILTKRGYVPIGELTKSDWVAFPRERFTSDRQASIATANFCEVRFRMMNDHERQTKLCQSSSVEGRAVAVYHRSSLPEVIQLTRRFGRIIGLFLAEGNTTKHTTVFSFNEDERETLVKEVVDFFAEVFNVTARIQNRGGRATKCVKVRIDGGNWAHLFERLCGTGSGEKHLHPSVARGSRDFLEGVFSGWLDGDGCKHQRGYHIGVTISHKLAMTMFDIANSLGLRPTISGRQPKVSHGVKVRRFRWDITIPKVGLDTYRCKSGLDDRWMWKRVRTVKREPFSGHVYNMEVEGDNSYVAEGVGVHNCAGHAGAANFSHRQYVETGEAVKYSPWFSYITSQRRGGFSGRDGGTSIKSVIDSATLDGCCLESMCPRPSRYSMTLSQDAIRDAAAHKHIGGVVDLREWDTCIDWLTDRRSVVIGTRWYSAQSSVGDVETKSEGSSGTFRGYHARALIGHRKIDGVVSPVVLNSHGKSWGTNGRAVIERDLWEWWKNGDANFTALGFTDISERIPARRDWSTFNWTGGGVPSWAGGHA